LFCPAQLTGNGLIGFPEGGKGEMKKSYNLLLIFVMALVIAMSMSVTAFAAGEQSGTSTVTAVVPDPEYTIQIPADMTLEYGNGERQLVGEVFVTDVKNLADGTDIDVMIRATPLKSTEGNEIPVVFEYGRDYNEEYNSIVEYSPTLYKEEEDEYLTAYLYATVTEAAWKAAKPGTYTSTITYNFRGYF
jgi:type 1 fimbria pilin